jgi:hypothetical protein
VPITQDRHYEGILALRIPVLVPISTIAIATDHGLDPVAMRRRPERCLQSDNLLNSLIDVRVRRITDSTLVPLSGAAMSKIKKVPDWASRIIDHAPHVSASVAVRSSIAQATS